MSDAKKGERGPGIRAWIEAMRLRTLPVSVAGVIAGTACAVALRGVRIVPALICLAFAVLAQIVSNFANEYYDYRAGLDRQGREGFRRGVTEGDISPEAMLRATYGLLAVACLTGLSLTLYGGWWLVFPGMLIAVFALAYSTGPWPLSHHGLGDVAVVVFFGIVPVVLTAYVQAGARVFAHPMVWMMGTGIGLLAANVLIVNNYRDADDDRAVGKHTTVVLLGRRTMSTVYLIGGILGVALVNFFLPRGQWAVVAVETAAVVLLWQRLCRVRGAALNRLLGRTALCLLGASVAALVIFAVSI